MVHLPQIFGFFDGSLSVAAFTSSAATSDIVTAAITAVLTTAAKDGSSVPLQVASGDAEGVVTSVIIEVYDATSKDKILADADGNEVYGKITEAAGVYTLSYYYLSDLGVETAYTMAGQAIDFGIQYRFSMGDLPYDFALSNSVSQDATGGGSSNILVETLAVTALNTVANATIPAGFEIKTAHEITINGVGELGNGMAVSNAGVITVTQATLGYDVKTTYRVRIIATLGLI